MKISIFKDYNLLKNYLLSKKESIAVLDFTGNNNVKETGLHEIVYRIPFDSHQKERIMRQYVEVISDIGARNNYSISWLCHPISEKNDLVPNNLLFQIVEFLSFYKFFSDFKKKELTILTQSVSLINNIIYFSNICNINCEPVGLKGSRAPSFKSFAYNFRMLRKKLSEIRTSRFLLSKLDKGKSYIVIRTWFDHRSKLLINEDRDVYFGRLPEFLKKKGKEILYFGGITNFEFNDVFKYLKGTLKNPILLESSLLNWFDYLKTSLFHFICKYRIRLPDKIMIQGVDLSFIFKTYFKTELKNSAISRNYLSYLAVKKLLRRVKVEEFFNLFENYAWEKVTTLAVSESSKKIKLRAFQHAQVALNSTKFFLGKKESHFMPLPEQIITLGEVTRDFLVKEKNYPPEITVTGCALRQGYQNINTSFPRKSDNRILFFLWSFERSIEMLNFLHASRVPQDRYMITVSPHPNHPFDKLRPHLNFQYNGNFKILNDSLEEHFKNADIVVYSGTTTSLDALAFGLPVINVEFNDFISPDPLFCFSDFKWTIKRPEELLPAIEAIRKLTDDEYYTRQVKALNFVRKYFYAVNDRNLKVFFE